MIRDYIFRETVSCPLKLSFLLKEKYNDQREDLFRRKVKRTLRESLARQFDNLRYTSDSADLAVAETEEWLQQENVAICGALIRTDQVRARIPILLKNDNKLSLIQIHGKAVKNNPSVLFLRQPLNRSIQRYLLKAAYRYQVVHTKYPEADISCLFMFPQKAFRAETDHLYEKTQGAERIEPGPLSQLTSLFESVEATEQVKEVCERIPSGVSHTYFKGKSVEEAIVEIDSINSSKAPLFVDQVHLGCKYCRFRKAENQHEDGCWDIHFHEEGIQNRDRHLFELIGHHVQEEHLYVEKFQEKVTQPGAMDTARKIMEHTDEKIAIYHRKAMQILDAKNEELPLIFAKKMLGRVMHLEYPLHFIDFEAATNPVPSKAGAKPYDPLLFQFSCHTLAENGELFHTQWLDDQNSKEPQRDLVAGLQSVPELSRGTIVQFSPFERQAFYKLFHELKQNPVQNRKEIDFLENILKVKRGAEAERFVDLSILLKDGYYNRFMNHGLSLKEILYAVLQAEKLHRTFTTHRFTIEGEELDLFKENEDGRLIDPYYQLSDERSKIRNGITAMHAYLCLKAGTLSERQQKIVPGLLKKYCSIDSLALYLIFIHLKNIVSSNDKNEDVVIDE